jgi:type III restriction enzyme
MAQTVIRYNTELPYIEDRNPWSKPTSFLVKAGPNSFNEIEGRRISRAFLVNKLRAEVDVWRNNEYEGASNTTKELLNFWFESSHKPVFGNQPFQFYFCQREAIETIIYLFEVKKFNDLAPIINEFHDEYPDESLFGDDVEIVDDVDGNRKVRRYFPENKQIGEQFLPEEDLLRFAIKMATGSGKTMVMALAIVWSYFNNLKEKDNRFSNNYLIIAPNVIVYERLAKDFKDGKIFMEFPYIPEAWKSLWKLNVKLRGDESPLSPNNNLILNNIHQLYESRIKEFKPNTIIEAILGRKPAKDPAKPPQTLLERIKELDNLMVLNDEAHHVHDDELKWNESLLGIHHDLPKGLMLWLDYSATPRPPDSPYYPWIITDYPLAQAVEDRIVKVPLIVHKVNKRDPENITAKNVVSKYNDWITAALVRYKEHLDTYSIVGKKPVLFIMAEKNDYADEIAKAIQKMGNRYGISNDEVLTIHTDTKGNIKKGDLEKLREDARDVDHKDNKTKVIVSVLMLREGWDVQSVTIVLGLRAFGSVILPEQAIGRGLRLLRDIGPDRTQTLEVIGNDNFEKIVKELEKEGVGVRTTNDPPPMPIIIAPEKQRLEYDIEIPQTDFSYVRFLKDISKLKPTDFKSLYSFDKLSEEKKVVLKMEMFQLGVEVHSTEIDADYLEIGEDLIASITRLLMSKAGLTAEFQLLYPIVLEYIMFKCFEFEIKDIENEKLRKTLREREVQEAIADLITEEVKKETVKEKEIKIKAKSILLSGTPKYTWRRKRTICKKTVFNFVALYNDFEKEFAEFLDSATDIKAFAALADIFKIDYLTSKGAIRFYYPDFVGKQETKDGIVYWILETKGREYPELENKNKAIERWCKSVTEQSDSTWKYLLIKQRQYNAVKRHLKLFQSLVDYLETEDMSIFK